MQQVFIANRASLSDATDLMGRFGESAAREAAARASVCRNAGNVVRYCHWRQIEWVIASLRCREVIGTVH